MLHFRTKVIAATFMGTVFQWLEYGSYSILIPMIAALFYPVDTNTYAIGTEITALFSFILLPIGAIFFGAIGDLYGRKKAFVTSIFLMGIASLSLGYLPTYSEIGMIAPLLLFFFRFIQGTALAGTLAGASIFIVEQRKNFYPNLVACWIPIASGIGLLAAFTLIQNLNHQVVMSWGWRIPFFLSAINCILAAYLHFSSRETAAFKQQTQNTPRRLFPLFALCLQHKMSFLKAFSIAVFTVVYFTICTTYYHSVLLVFLDLSHLAALSLLLFEVIAFLILLPIIAFISDKIGGRSIAIMGLLGCSLSAPLLFIAAPAGSLFILFCVEGFFALFTASALAPLFRFQLNLFPVSIRYTALSLTWALGLSLLSRPTIELAQYMMHLTHRLALPAIIASASALLTCLIVFISYPRAERPTLSPHELENNTKPNASNTF